MKLRNSICFLLLISAVAIILSVSCYRLSKENHQLKNELVQYVEKTTEETSKIAEEKAVAGNIVSGLDAKAKITENTRYRIEIYEEDSASFHEVESELPKQLYGCSLEQAQKWVEEEAKKENEKDSQVKQMELVWFSDTQITVRKIVSSLLVDDFYYLALENGYVTVYNGDKSSVYLQTDISQEDIPWLNLQDLKTGIYVENLKEVYDYLESCSS